MSYAIKMIEVKCDDKIHNFPEEISAGEVIKKIFGKKSGAIAALVNHEEKDLSHIIKQNCEISMIKDESDEGLYIMRHSCAHL